MARKKIIENAAPVEAQSVPALPPVQSIKGFDANWRCRGYQFELGKTYVYDGKVEACEVGFHACPVEHHPFSVFEFYPPAGNRFALVTQDGERSAKKTKLASARLTLDVELTISDLVKHAWEFVWSRAKLGGECATGYQGAASATSNRGAASATGYQGAASATGDYGAASATGYQGAASATGTQGAASATGYQGAASATGYQGAASATGTQGAASATGTQGAASATGTQGAASVSGKYGHASATGPEGKVMAAGDMQSLFAREFDDEGQLVSVACGIVGKGGIKAGFWYRCKDGELVEVA